jgi:hypothetical protein
VPVFVNVPPVPVLVAMPDAGPRSRSTETKSRGTERCFSHRGIDWLSLGSDELRKIVGVCRIDELIYPNLNIRETNGGIDSVGCPRWQCATIA